MKIEKKIMSKNNWKRVQQKKYVYTKLEEEILQGECSLLHILKVTSPGFKQYGNLNIKIVDTGYYWLQIALEKENYWITAMYNENKQIVQYYIDITERNVITNDGNSYFYDLILDIVYVDGKIILLDEDELKQALQENNITQEQYNFAYKIANKMISENNSIKLYDLCEKYFNILVNKLEEV